MSFNSTSASLLQPILPSFLNVLIWPFCNATELALTNLFQDNIWNIFTKFTQSLLILHTTDSTLCTTATCLFHKNLSHHFVPYLYPKQRPPACDIKWIIMLGFAGPIPCGPSLYLHIISILFLLIQLGSFSPCLYTQVIHTCPSRSRL